MYRSTPVRQAQGDEPQTGAGLRPRMIGRKSLWPGQGVGRVSCGQEVSRAGRSSLSARSARLTSCPCRWPHCCSDFLVKRVGSKSNRVTAGIIGGGSTDKATRPTGVLTLTRQKEPTGEFLPNPPSPDRHGCANAQRSLTAGDKHSAFASFLRRSVGCSVLPRWRGLVLSLPSNFRLNAVWPSATH